MRKLLAIVILAVMAIPGLVFASSKILTQQKQQDLTPNQVLARLEAGNDRFVKGTMQRRDYAKAMKTTATQGQHPMAVVVSCVDSRSIPNVLFDQGVGNIFTARVAGNVIGKDVLASLEFATASAGAKLILVLGHTQCGALQGACMNKPASASLRHLFAQIKPAVSTVRKSEGKAMNCSDPETLEAIANQNVLNQMNYILAHSPIIKRLVAEKKVRIVGGVHDLKTGDVEFFDFTGNEI